LKWFVADVLAVSSGHEGRYTKMLVMLYRGKFSRPRVLLIIMLAQN